MEQQIRPALEPVISIIKLGFSVFIEQILMRVGFMSTAMMAAKMGTNALAAHQVGMNILGLTFSFGDGMQVAAVALIGRSLGEGSPDKAKAYGKTCRMIGLGISCVLAVVYFFGGEWLYHLFFAEQEIVDIGVMIIRIMIIIYYSRFHRLFIWDVCVVQAIRPILQLHLQSVLRSSEHQLPISLAL